MINARATIYEDYFSEKLKFNEKKVRAELLNTAELNS